MKIVLSLLLMIIAGFTHAQNHELQLKSHEQFMEMSSAPLYQKYGQVSALKVVYDNSTERLHFISSQRYDFHYEFCMQELGYRHDLERFNNDAYSADTNKQFLIANLNFYAALNQYALELGPSDQMDFSLIDKLFEAVKEDVFCGSQLVLMLNTVHVNQLADKLHDIPTITPKEIYAGQVYQPISEKKVEGRLVVVTDWEKQKNDIRPHDIILVKNIPKMFPLVSGVVVTTFQTPLSHVSLLGKNRKIPICAYTKLFQSSDLLALNGKTVSFEVKRDTFLIQEISVYLEDNWIQGKRIKLKLDLDVDSLIPIEYLKERHSSAVGNKAANFGELNNYAKRIDFLTPESAFAIPFFFYNQHIQACGLSDVILRLSDQNNMERSREEVEMDLKVIRTRIREVAIDSILINDIEGMILRLGDFKRMRFRSSTNAEDMEGFSGAGLYQSKTGELYSNTKTIEKAIISVWSSLWSYEAFMEREAFNIDQTQVAMGILVHRSFPNEEVNGVAITTNIYRDNYLGFVVNAQLGDESVVAPKEGVICDQFICYPDESATIYGKEEGAVDIIAYSSLNNGELVMTMAEIQNLANVLEKIKRQYIRKHYIKSTYFNFGLDIEFKLDKESRALYIKQMRLYNR